MTLCLTDYDSDNEMNEKINATDDDDKFSKKLSTLGPDVLNIIEFYTNPCEKLTYNGSLCFGDSRERVPRQCKSYCDKFSEDLRNNYFNKLIELFKQITKTKHHYDELQYYDTIKMYFLNTTDTIFTKNTTYNISQFDLDDYPMHMIYPGFFSRAYSGPSKSELAEYTRFIDTLNYGPNLSVVVIIKREMKQFYNLQLAFNMFSGEISGPCFVKGGTSVLKLSKSQLNTVLIDHYSSISPDWFCSLQLHTESRVTLNYSTQIMLKTK